MYYSNNVNSYSIQGALELWQGGSLCLHPTPYPCCPSRLAWRPFHAIPRASSYHWHYCCNTWRELFHKTHGNCNSCAWYEENSRQTSSKKQVNLCCIQPAYLFPSISPAQQVTWIKSGQTVFPPPPLIRECAFFLPPALVKLLRAESCGLNRLGQLGIFHQTACL